MHSKAPSPFTLLCVGTAAWFGAVGSAMAQTPSVHPIPQSIALEHQETLDRLAVLAQRSGEVGLAARNAEALFKRHVAREEEYILPPLTALPDLAKGKFSGDQGWIVAMTDRVKADQDAIFLEHSQITEAANALLAAGQRAHDQQAIDFAHDAVLDSLNDLEIEEPAVLLMGQYIHAAALAKH